MVYTVTLNPSLDYVVSVEEFRTGKLNRASREKLTPGGKGINVSAVLQNFGVENTALGFLAGFTGDEIKARLEKMGIRTDFIKLPEGFSRINVKLCSGEETEINGTGPAVGEDELAMLTKKLERLREGDYLVLAGSAPGGVSEELYAGLQRSVKGRGVRTVVDASGGLLARALPERPFLIKPNRAELEELAGERLEGVSGLLKAASGLRERGAMNVLVSLGREGALLLSETGGAFRVCAPQGKQICSVGAGDSMVAGFLASFLAEGNYERALCAGTAAGSAAAFSDSLPGAAEAEALLRAGLVRPERLSLT